MIRKKWVRFSSATNAKRLRGDHAQTKKIERDDDSKKSSRSRGSPARFRHDQQSTNVHRFDRRDLRLAAVNTFKRGFGALPCQLAIRSLKAASSLNNLQALLNGSAKPVVSDHSNPMSKSFPILRGHMIEITDSIPPMGKSRMVHCPPCKNRRGWSWVP